MWLAIFFYWTVLLYRVLVPWELGMKRMILIYPWTNTLMNILDQTSVKLITSGPGKRGVACTLSPKGRREGMGVSLTSGAIRILTRSKCIWKSVANKDICKAGRLKKAEKGGHLVSFDKIYYLRRTPRDNTLQKLHRLMQNTFHDCNSVRFEKWAVVGSEEGKKLQCILQERRNLVIFILVFLAPRTVPATQQALLKYLNKLRCKIRWMRRCVFRGRRPPAFVQCQRSLGRQGVNNHLIPTGTWNLFEINVKNWLFLFWGVARPRRLEWSTCLKIPLATIFSR